MWLLPGNAPRTLLWTVRGSTCVHSCKFHSRSAASGLQEKFLYIASIRMYLTSEKGGHPVSFIRDQTLFFLQYFHHPACFVFPKSRASPPPLPSPPPYPLPLPPSLPRSPPFSRLLRLQRGVRSLELAQLAPPHPASSLAATASTAPPSPSSSSPSADRPPSSQEDAAHSRRGSGEEQGREDAGEGQHRGGGEEEENEEDDVDVPEVVDEIVDVLLQALGHKACASGA